MPVYEIEMYDGNGTPFYWDENSNAHVCIRNNVVCVTGNKEFFISLAKQMLYFACNDFCLPHGTHVHYDQSFGQDYTGLEMVLEVIPEDHQAITLDVSESVSVRIDLPENTCRLHMHCDDRARIVVSYDTDVYILANYHGFVFLATVLLFLAETGTRESSFFCEKSCICGWQGYEVMFELLS